MAALNEIDITEIKPEPPSPHEPAEEPVYRDIEVPHFSPSASYPSEQDDLLPVTDFLSVQMKEEAHIPSLTRKDSPVRTPTPRALHASPVSCVSSSMATGNHSSLEFEVDGDWTERFIQTIQSKPALYDKKLKEHSDRNTISRLWAEVCEVMINSWNEMSPQKKAVKGKEIQQRWRNLRTCFRRELNKQHKVRSGKTSGRRRKYVYFDQLLFLLPSIEDRETEPRETVSETLSPRMEVDMSDNEDELPQTSSSQVQHPPAKKPKKNPSCEESIMNMLMEKKSKYIDEDETFLLSLVPSFKRMTDDQKIEAKMEFLSVIRRITQPKPAYSIAQAPNLHFQGSHHFNHGLQHSPGSYYPQNPSQHMVYHSSRHQNVAMQSASSTPTPSDNSRSSRVSSNPASPQSELYEQF